MQFSDINSHSFSPVMKNKTKQITFVIIKTENVKIMLKLLMLKFLDYLLNQQITRNGLYKHTVHTNFNSK